MRYALRPQDLNVVQSAAEAGAKPTPQPVDDVHDSLREWRQRWRDIMKSAIIYFDGTPQLQVTRLKSHLNVLGSQVQPFFDQRVTHVISENAKSDVALKAKEAHRKVYTVEKLARFLSSLLGHSVTTVLDETQSAKLARMLEEDKRKSAHATPYARKDDFYYFKGPYLLIWDPSKYNRPMCLKEWRPSATSEEGEWPQLRRAPMGMSPFTARAIVRSEKRKQHRQVKLEESEDEINTQFDKKTTSDAGNLEKKPDFAAKRRQAEPEENKENAVTQMRLVPLAAHATNSTRLREFGEIVASGVPRYSQTSANPLAARKETAGSRELVNLRRKVLPRPQASITECSAEAEGCNTLPPAPANTLASRGSVQASGIISPAMSLAAASASMPDPVKPRPVAVPKPKARKPGYCENCLEKYDELSEHLASKRHRLFAASDQKFLELDRVIETLQRPRVLH